MTGLGAAPTEHVARRYPDFFVVGHPKSGTTALYGMLRQHPQIFLPSVKEPRFFLSDAEQRFHGRERMTEQHYLELYATASPGQKTGDASPQYLASRSALADIAAENASARIIAILREPAAFVLSLHLQYVRRGAFRVQDMGAALAAGPAHPLWRYYDERVRYVEQLERCRAVFPSDRVLILIYDDYRQANQETMRSIYRFLDVDETFEAVPVEMNGSVGVRSRVVAAAWQQLTRGQGALSGALLRAARGRVPQAPRDMITSLYRRVNLTSVPQADDELIAQMRAIFAPEVDKLSEYLDRDLADLWGYARV